MLMYGFQPRSPVTVGLATEKLQHVKDFLQGHMDMLKLARQNVHQAQDRYKKYADEKVHKLSSRKVTMFSYELVGSMAYKLELLANSRIHPVFHVSRLRQHLLWEDNIIDQEVLVDFIEPPNLPHEPERIFDSYDSRTRHHVRHQVLVKWKNRPEEGATWENVSTLRKRFPLFVFEDENTSPRGGVMLGQGS
ncbi:hypothetical protein L7F22_026880 [Adiantum nelumboides]|nr:hypothetical protein [Adiantum nelumboides]